MRWGIAREADEDVVTFEARDEATAREMTHHGHALAQRIDAMEVAIEREGREVRFRSARSAVPNALVALGDAAMELATETPPETPGVGLWWTGVPHPEIGVTTLIARWPARMPDPEGATARALADAAMQAGAHWVWPEDEPTPPARAHQFGCALDDASGLLVAVVALDIEEAKAVWQSDALAQTIARYRAGDAITAWRGPHQHEDGTIEFAGPAPTGCPMTGWLIETYAQHGCEATLTSYAKATGQGAGEPAAEAPQVHVRTGADGLGEASRRVQLVCMTSAHIHERVDGVNDAPGEGTTVHKIDFVTTGAVRTVWSVVIVTTRPEDESAHAAALERHTAAVLAAGAVLAAVPSARWLDAGPLAERPRTIDALSEGQWVSAFAGIVEDPTLRDALSQADMEGLIAQAAEEMA